MPAGWALIAGRLIWNASGSWRGRILAVAGLSIPILFGLAEPLRGSGVMLPVSIVIFVATALGLPIFAALGGVALLCFWNDGVPSAAVPGESYRLTASAYLPAIPLFTLGGYILAAGGASRRLMRSFTALFGWMPGGLAIVTAFCSFFHYAIKKDDMFKLLGDVRYPAGYQCMPDMGRDALYDVSHKPQVPQDIYLPQVDDKYGLEKSNISSLRNLRGLLARRPSHVKYVLVAGTGQKTTTAFFFNGTIAPRRYPPSAVITIFA
jgi:hypothetical protein